ncbi:MAG: hypothetical protein ACYSYT_08470, partial [Planctomycetota bacterium]
MAERIGAELAGDGSAEISAVGPVEAAGEADVTFITDGSGYGGRSGEAKDARRISELGKSRAGAVIVSQCIEGLAKPQLVVKNVDAALIETLKIFAPKLKAATAGIDSTAQIGRDVKIGQDVSIGPWVVVEDGAEIGAKSIIASGCRIGENSRVGDNCRLDSNVVVYHNCTIGNNVVIQANSTIGSTGFGYSFIDG